MPLSSVLGAQSLVRPGVCTSSTRPASPFEGQVIYETDTNQTLVYSGSAWVMIADTDTPPGLQLIKNEAVGTAVSNLTVNNIFSSEFDAYKIVLSNVDSSASANYMQIQLVDSGGTAATTGYSFAGIYMTYASATVNGIIDSYWGIGLSATNFGGSFELYNPFLSVATYGNSSNTDDTYFRSYGWKHSTAASYTGLKFIASSGTMTGGTIRVYGYRNS